jgi:hypothetical protein
VVYCYKGVNKPSILIACGKSVDQLRKLSFLKKDSGPWTLINYRVGSLVSYLVRYGIRKYEETVVTAYMTSTPRDVIVSFFQKLLH